MLRSSRCEESGYVFKATSTELLDDIFVGISVANSTIYELLRSHNPISLKKEKKMDLGQVLVNCNSLNVMILLVTVNLKNEHNR